MTDALRASEFSGLLEYAQDIIIVVDASGTVSYVNPAIEDILGYTQAEMIGKNAFDLMHPEDREAVATRFSELIDRPGQATDRVQHRLEHAAGGWRWVESIGSNQTDAAFDGYVINSRDITERKQREREFAEQRALLEAQQDAVLDGILVVDETGDVLSANDRVVDLWGLPPAVLDGDDDRSPLEYVTAQVAHPGDFEETVDYLDEHAGETARDELELEDGRVFDVYTAPLRADDGRHFGRLWTFRDITERIERESELQKQNERLDQFASIVSHDLRNPLNVAAGGVELAREECDSEHLDAVVRAHDRIEELIEDLLTLARLGQQMGDRDVVDLDDVVAEAWRTVDTGDATLRTDADRAIRANRSRLLQALENLVRNSVEHGGAKVTVTVGQVDDGFVVADDGPGIPPEAQKEVFDAGYSTATEGTGFGLSIVEQVIEAHGWTIRVHNGEDGGAQFEITGVAFADG